MDTSSSQRTIIVTGGAGYIGSHACKALAKAGYLPVTVDDLSRGHADAVRWGPLEQASLLDADAVSQIFLRHRPVAVMHFAAYIAAGESVEQPDLYYRNNLGALLSVLNACRVSDVQRIVFSSTAALYGAPQTAPIAEDHALIPINPYGASKLFCERMLADHSAAFGTRWLALRYFNAAGADPQGETGERHAPETHLIPLALRAATDPAFTLSILGADYDTPDGTAIRDYVHVTDIVAAHMAALAAMDNGLTGRAFNLGTGAGNSVKEVVEAVERITGRKVKTSLCPRRAGDAPRLVADADAAWRALGWRPQADLEAIIRSAAAWHEGREWE